MMESNESRLLMIELSDIYLQGKELVNHLGKNENIIPLRKIAYLNRMKNSLSKIYDQNMPFIKKIDMIKMKGVKAISHCDIIDAFNDFEEIFSQIKFYSTKASGRKSFVSKSPITNNIFIIHGRDELNTLRLKAFIQDHCKLDPILMMRREGMSRALLDKFEDDASTCSMAFVLFTIDDHVTNGKDSYDQARPNVIFEVGWFIGRLGRSRVCILLQDGARIHSDLDGISQIRFRDNIEEKGVEIMKELKAVGIPIE